MKAILIIALIACASATFLPAAISCDPVLELQCALKIKGAVSSCTAAAAQSGLNPISDYKCVKNVLGVENKCVSCVCDVAKSNNWTWLDAVCKENGYNLEAIQVQDNLPSGCGLELEEKCAIDLETSVKQCTIAFTEKFNPIADYKCVVDAIHSVQDCEECICTAAEKNNWVFIEKECQIFEQNAEEEEVVEEEETMMIQVEEVGIHGCGIELEELCGIDLYMTFEQCAKAEAQGGMNIIADFKCVKDIINAAEECDACICKAAEENGWAWIQKEVCPK